MIPKKRLGKMRINNRKNEEYCSLFECPVCGEDIIKPTGEGNRLTACSQSCAETTKEKNPFKFRAWDKKNKRWMTPEIEDTEESEIRLDLWGNVEFRLPWWDQGADTICAVDGSEMFDIMQSTGLCDSNNVEIYEGDIVILCWSDEVGESHWGKVTIKNPFEYTPEEARYFIYSDGIEVIGNIYENPELPEVAE